MRQTGVRPLARSVVLGLALVVGCGTDDVAIRVDAAPATPTPAATLRARGLTPSPPPTATPTPEPTPTPTPTPEPTPAPRRVHAQEFEPFGAVGEMVLYHPATEVELIGFHESGQDGSKPITLVEGAAPSVVLETRFRDTDPASAADVVVAPGTEIRSPVTGTVTSAGTYVLYCDYSDDLLFIEPDEYPGWQLRIFHIDGVAVAPGERVEAGTTVIAPRATQLPFASQVDEHTAEPSWPHVHIELVDPSVPDRPTGPGC